jgi:hypothetical protein
MGFWADPENHLRIFLERWAKSLRKVRKNEVAEIQFSCDLLVGHVSVAGLFTSANLV